ncbi:MAG: hypothetical protein QOF61_2025 [Acidobacteriota bacterium]|jgi:hypothetical protein|nr:hypothetical protein [Acidobacteriota bacterium]
MREISTFADEQVEFIREQLYPEHRQASAPQPAPRDSFMRRQFIGRATHGQKIFDVVFGVILPVLCFIFDPVVFRGGLHDAPLLGRYRLFAYGVSALGIVALVLWLAAGDRVREWGGMLGGVLLAGALFSFVVGVLISPYSLLGLIILIGALGFIPFFTAFVYLRSGVRALRASELHVKGTRRALAITFGAVLSLAAPAYAHLKIERIVARALPDLTSDDGTRADAAARRLRRVGWIAGVDYDELAWTYARETDATRRERLARAYRALTGRSVEDRLSLLND